MNTDKKISRREALKRMGFAVMSGAITSSGLLSLASCETKRSKRIIFYFTGTGNSLYIARQLAGENAELLSIPQMVEIWDRISCKADNAFDYINTIIMVDNWLPNFDMNEQLKIDKHIPENLQKITADINSRQHWHEPVTEEERQQHQGFMQRSGLDPEVGFLMKSEKFFTVTDACIDCGICTYVCPRGNYELTSRGVKTSGDCEFCFACIQNCPQKAIQFIKQEDGSFPDGTEKNPNARYRNEHISLIDLKRANNQNYNH